MRSFFPLIPLSIACQQPPEYLETALPQMELSTTTLEFGEIGWGTNLTKSFYVENQGELPMGLHALKMAEEGFETNFNILLGLDGPVYSRNRMELCLHNSTTLHCEQLFNIYTK